MAEKYQLHPATVKMLSGELKRAVDDYNDKKIDSEQLKNLIIHWNQAYGKKLMCGPNQFTPTINQRLGERRLDIIRVILTEKTNDSKINNNKPSEKNPLATPGLIIMVGFPLSGKSTLAKKCTNYAPRVTLISLDTIRLAVHGKQYDQSQEPFVWSIAFMMAKSLLLDNFTVIVDATNVTKDSRKKWSVVAQKIGLPFTIFHVNTSPDVCRERNKKQKRFPESVINEKVKLYKAPTNKEGVIYDLNAVEQFLSN